MATLLPRFNAERRTVDGRSIFVTGVPASSGDVEMKIVRGRMKPHAWSPASSLWGRLLNHEADRKFVGDENPSLASSPVVIAMWEPFARALGWPRKAIGFKDILELSTTKSNWAEHGLPTYGHFKLGHTNPDFSTSGLSFVAAQYYTATGKREGLTRRGRGAARRSGRVSARSSSRSSTTATPAASSPSSSQRTARDMRPPLRWRRRPCSSSTRNASRAKRSSSRSTRRRARSSRTTRTLCWTRHG